MGVDLTLAADRAEALGPVGDHGPARLQHQLPAVGGADGVGARDHGHLALQRDVLDAGGQAVAHGVSSSMSVRACSTSIRATSALVSTMKAWRRRVKPLATSSYTSPG